MNLDAVPQDIRRPEVFDGGSLASVAGVMAEDILPNDPTECRRRNRLYAIRAMDRLGLLGEGSLIPTLGSRPDLRWLVDEAGARWDILIELGRIREQGAFEGAVEWVLENRPHTEEAKAYIRRLRISLV